MIVLLVLSLYFFFLPTFGPIDAANAPRNQLLLWLAFRDFSRQKSPTLDALVDRFQAEYGPPSGKPPTFSFTDTEKRFYAPPDDKKKQQESLIARNIDTLMKIWYMRQLARFEAAPLKDKSRIVRECIDEFKWWETIYVNYLTAVERPIPTRLEFAQEFEAMIQRFGSDEDAASRQRIAVFKSLIITGFVGRELNKPTPGSAPGGTFFDGFF